MSDFFLWGGWGGVKHTSLPQISLLSMYIFMEGVVIMCYYKNKVKKAVWAYGHQILLLSTP